MLLRKLWPNDLAHCSSIARCVVWPETCVFPHIYGYIDTTFNRSSLPNFAFIAVAMAKCALAAELESTCSSVFLGSSHVIRLPVSPALAVLSCLVPSPPPPSLLGVHASDASPSGFTRFMRHVLRLISVPFVDMCIMAHAYSMQHACSRSHGPMCSATRRTLAVLARSGSGGTRAPHRGAPPLQQLKVGKRNGTRSEVGSREGAGSELLEEL